MLYSKVELPFVPNDIPTGKKIARWNYVARYIPEYDENIPFGLLIGGNCVKALELCQVEPRQGDGPYAMRACLRRCLVVISVERPKEL